MTQERWTAVDNYFADLLVPTDPALDAALQSSDAAGLPPAAVAPNQGKLLMLLAQIQRARTILEIGTLGGYSTIWLARGAARRWTLDHAGSEPQTRRSRSRQHHPRGIIWCGGFEGWTGNRDAAHTCRHAPFDLIFIDADKPSNPEYFVWALKLSRKGTLIIADNVVRDGAVIIADGDDPSVVGIRRFNELVAAEPRVTATAIQTVGSKGYDGFRPDPRHG